MKRNILLVIIAFIIHWIVMSVIIQLQMNVQIPGGLILYISLLQNYFPLFMGVLIGFFGRAKSWRYAMLYGILYPITAYITQIILFNYGEVTIDLLGYLLVTSIILATIGGFAGAHLQELHKPLKNKE